MAEHLNEYNSRLAAELAGLYHELRVHGANGISVDQEKRIGSQEFLDVFTQAGLERDERQRMGTQPSLEEFVANLPDLDSSDDSVNGANQ